MRKRLDELENEEVDKELGFGGREVDDIAKSAGEEEQEELLSERWCERTTQVRDGRRYYLLLVSSRDIVAVVVVAVLLVGGVRARERERDTQRDRRRC